MSVIGIGTDIIDIRRISKMAEQAREKLAQRILTGSELAEYRGYLQVANAIAFLAKRWAGKEAVAKALGTGIGSGISFQHMQIEHLPSGQPVLVLTDLALVKATSLGATQWHISLSDEQHYATSFVVLSK